MESKSGKLLWDATVKEVSQEREDGPVTGYKVEYKGWGERFDEWVVPSRLVEPSENNRQVQVSCICCYYLFWLYLYPLARMVAN